MRKQFNALFDMLRHPVIYLKLRKLTRSIANGEWMEVAYVNKVQYARFFMHKQSLEVIAVRPPLASAVDTYFLPEGMLPYKVTTQQRNMLAVALVSKCGSPYPGSINTLTSRHFAHVLLKMHRIINEQLASKTTMAKLDTMDAELVYMNVKRI